MTRAQELVTLLNKANQDYYLDGESAWSDEQYREYKEELAGIKNTITDETLLTAANLILESVGATPLPSSSLSRVTHQTRMWSLNNSYSEADLAKWESTLPRGSKLGVSDKKDGSAVELVYIEGILEQGSTRGDGVTGEDITASLRALASIPKKIKLLGRVEVTGEAVLPLAGFEKAKEMDEYEYKNARNAANGIIRRKTPSASASLIEFYAYSIKSSAFVSKTYHEDLEALETLGFQTVPFTLCDSLEAALKAIKVIDDNRKDNKTLIDGAVVRVDSHEVYQALGYDSKAPKGAIAHKFESIKAEAILKEVVWTKGRKGKVSPNGRYEPIDLGGITNDRCLMHTYSLIQALGAKIGSRILVEKCADVIPQVHSVRTDLHDGTEIDIVAPTGCPVCNGPLTMRGDYHYCENTTCDSNAQNGLLTWAEAIGFKGIGPASAEKLAANGSYKRIPDFFRLTIEDFEKADVASKNAAKLVKAIADIKTSIEPQQVLHGFSIDYCGKGTSTDIIQDAEIKLLDMVGQSQAWFEQIHTIGPVTARSLEKWFNDSSNRAMIAELVSMGIIREAKKKETVVGGSLVGELICITGTLSQDKKDFYPLIEAAGGAWTESFKKTITKMVVGDKAGSKESKAKAAGIAIWTEDDLKRVLNI